MEEVLNKEEAGQRKVRPLRFKSYTQLEDSTSSHRSIHSEGFPLRSLAAHCVLLMVKNKAEWIEIALPNLDYASGTIKAVTNAYYKVSKAWNGSFTHEVSCVDAVTISKEMDGQTSAQSPEFFCPLPIAYNPFTRQPVQFLYFDPGCKTALTGIKTDGTICEYDISPLRHLNLNTIF